MVSRRPDNPSLFRCADETDTSEQSNLLQPVSVVFRQPQWSPARVHFAKPAVDSRWILRVDVTHKESFQMEPFPISSSPSLPYPPSHFLTFSVLRGTFYSYLTAVLWEMSLSVPTARPFPPLATSSCRDIDDCSFPGLCFFSSDATYFRGVTSNSHSIRFRVLTSRLIPPIMPAECPATKEYEIKATRSICPWKLRF